MNPPPGATAADASLPLVSTVATHIDKSSLLDDSIHFRPRLPLLSSSTDGIQPWTPGPGAMTPCLSMTGLPPLTSIW